jgi:HEAT repeat protein
MSRTSSSSLVLVLAVTLPILLLGGCDTAQPTLAGAKWAKALRDPDARMRRKAAFTLGNIGPSDAAVLPALMEALKDPVAEVRCEAILALMKCGSQARAAIPALTDVQDKDRDARVRSYAAKALRRLQGDG